MPLMLGTTWWTFLVLLVLVSAYSRANIYPSTSSSNIVIVVNGLSNNNASSCNNEQQEVICVTSFNMALQEIQNTTFVNILIQVNPGNYTLESSMVNNVTCSRNEADVQLTIRGINTEQTVLNCEPSAGIYIYNCFNVTLELITLNQCGYDNRLPLSLYGFGNFFPYSRGLQPAAVFIAFSHYVLLANVTIRNSQGSGLLLHSIEATISSCIITGGRGVTKSTDDESISGGIVLLNFYRDNSIAHRVSITDSIITNNDYSSANPIIEDIAYGGAALTVLELPIYLFEVHSSVITNNSRGLFVYSRYSTDIQALGGFPLMNNSQDTDTLALDDITMSHNWNDSVITLDKSKMKLKLFDIVINKTIIVNPQNYYHQVSSEDMCADLTDSLDTSIQCSTSCIAPSIQFKYRCTSIPVDTTNSITPGICSNDSINGQYTGKCPIPYSAKISMNIVNHSIYGRNVFSDVVTTTYSCMGNRHGDLCSQCIEGHSVAINSPYLSCVPCNQRDVLIGWILLILLEFIPVTIMVAVIAVLNVNLNQGSLNAYIFFCQIITIPFPSVGYPSWFVVRYRYTERYFDILYQLATSSIWNLGFIYWPSCGLGTGPYSCHSFSICISQSTSALGAILIWYMIAFYPFLMVFLIYICVIGYNRGYRCVVRVIRPIHHLLARFWRMFDIQPSLPTTIASVYTLCFTQLAATSFKLLHRTTFKNEIIYFFDGSQKYFQTWQHGLAGTLALIVLIVFITVPVVYLSVYPFKWFQSCLNKVKIRKDLLISVTDVFTAPYSNGTTEKKRDYRYFAGMHFIFQLVAMSLYSLPSQQPTGILIAQTGLCCFFIVLLVMFRPYKRLSHTLIDVTITFTLQVFTLYGLIEVVGNYESQYYFTLLAFGILILTVHLFIVICYCVYWIYKKCKIACARHTMPVVSISQSNMLKSISRIKIKIRETSLSDDSFDADRMVNPAEYVRWEETHDDTDSSQRK